MTKRVLVTGASKGIGRAIALVLGQDGFDVAVHYGADLEGANETLAAIKAAGGCGQVLSFDIGNRAQCKEVLEANVEEHGDFWGVICNAGVIRDTAFPMLSDDDWDAVLHTNLDGFYNVVKPLVMPMIRQRNGGRVITMSSVSGVMGNRGQVNYSASKAGLIGASKALAIELAKRSITVNSVAPGLIETGMVDETVKTEAMKMIPLRRMGQPEEVAATVSFLMSEGAAYITRQVISVNGGMH